MHCRQHCRARKTHLGRQVVQGGASTGCRRLVRTQHGRAQGVMPAGGQLPEARVQGVQLAAGGGLQLLHAPDEGPEGRCRKVLVRPEGIQLRRLRRGLLGQTQYWQQGVEDCKVCKRTSALHAWGVQEMLLACHCRGAGLPVASFDGALRQKYSHLQPAAADGLPLLSGP
jgi:hypothetical protein